KHLVNDSKQLIESYLRSLTYLNDSLTFDQPNKIIRLRDIQNDRVHLLCGGGSGHEPAHSSFVGQGMLSASVCGNIFASPNSQQISSAIRTLSDSRGILMVVKNYTGDVLNFGVAKERFIAQNQQKQDNLKIVIVGDDVSVGREQGKFVGRRGLAGTVLVYKIAGALASRGATLGQVHGVAQYVADNLVTIGVGLDHCQIPGTRPLSQDDTDELGQDEIEIGMGIHNEPGYKRQKFKDLGSLISDLMKALTSTTDKDRSFLNLESSSNDNNSKIGTTNFEEGHHFIVLINNLGSMSDLEMGAIISSVGTWLFDNGFHADRVTTGKFMSALDMPGFSISLVLLPKKSQAAKIRIEEDELFEIDSELILELFDSPCETLGWNQSKITTRPPSNLGAKESGECKNSKVKDGKLFIEAIKSGCQALIDSEPEITRLDTILGDGDCGETLRNGARGVLDEISNHKINGEDLVDDLMRVSEVVDSQMGGTSGGLYSIFFNSLAIGISKFTENEVAEKSDWIKALDYSLSTMYKYTKARPPSSRTLIDPLSSFILSLSLRSEEADYLDQSIQEAKQSVESTIYLDSRFGRSGEGKDEGLEGGKKNLPDPGAWGVWKFLEGLGKSLT
ncbi:Dak1 domain-containing protein, partial [Phakopsora pachyrhizi]